MHALIIGAPGVGKSTLIQRVLAALGGPACGFETRKEDGLAAPDLGSPVYLYDVEQPRRQAPENLVGYVKDRRPEPRVETFARWGAKLDAMDPREGVMVMDELGTMESGAGAFCRAVLRRLEGDLPVIAAVKDKHTPFLDAVREHKNCRCFYITPGNREELLPEVIAFVQAQLR